MSVYAVRSLPCGACGEVRSVRTVQSANPTRHVAFRTELLDRTFNRFACRACGHVDVDEGPTLWTDIPADLVAMMMPTRDRIGWRQIEVEVAAALEGPVRDEGPTFVRDWGRGAFIRVVFGLEELREKVVIRQARLRDETIEVLKLPFGDLEQGQAPLVELVDDDGLHLAVPPSIDRPDTAPSSTDRTVAILTWRDYERRLARSDEDALAHPGLFLGTWVNWGRAAYAPLARAL
jgi:hypothetical protein